MKKHKDMTIKERAELIVKAYNSFLDAIKYKGERFSVEEILSDNFNKEHAIYFKIHFDEYFCPKCNKKFQSMNDILDDCGSPYCRRIVGKDEFGNPKECYGYPKKLPE